MDKQAKKISIVIPVYNEEKTVENIVNIVESAPTLGLEKEIILINDCSKDGTAEILKKYEGKHKVVHHPVNQGKGAALKTGFQNATGDIILIQDADLEYDPNEYPDLIKPIVDGKADVVYGSRFLTHRPHRVLYYWHSVGNRIITELSNMFSDLNLTDMETCYKVFRKEVLDQIWPKLESKRFGFEPEVTARVAKLAKTKNYKIFELGISYNGRTYAEGKHLGWKDGFEALWCIIKFNLFE